MSPDDFARFLECLSPDSEEAGRHYTRLHKKLVSFFVMRGISDPMDAADETIDRATVKICGGTPVPDVDKYSVGIARNIAREKWRREQRESSTFLLFIRNLADNCDEEIDRIYQVLKPCFEQLAVKERTLLATYYQVLRGRERAEHRRQMAETSKTTVLGLRMRVTRLRSILTNCVRNHSDGGLASF
jgi:DNA-directed RNA polymerase specialized sigma24 family protein